MFNPDIIVVLQSIGAWIIAPMRAITFLGDAGFYLFIAPAMYWCIDSRLGFRLSIYLIISASLNLVLKVLFQLPRPFWIDPAAFPYADEYSFGLPSGHAQNAVVVWGSIAAYYKKRWIWILLTGLIILIGISRLFLGVHFIADVLIGWVVGLFLLYILLKFEPRISDWLTDLTRSQKLGLGFLISAILVLAALSLDSSYQNQTIPEQWVQHASLFTPWDDEENPFSTVDLITFAGVIFGVICGKVFIDVNGGFEVNGSLLQKVIRFLIGFAGVFIVWAGLDLVFPEGITVIAHIFRYLRYFLVGFWMIGIAPFLFIALKLTDTSDK
jgi:membrane-associated phospholipid phosphatase